MLKSLLLSSLLLACSSVSAAPCPEYLNHALKKLHSSQTINICSAYAGKPLLIINTASHCGYTPQFKALEQLHQRYRDRGLVVLGFASDDFKQEAEDEQAIAEVCYRNFGVTFPMFAPIAVTGNAAHPLFKALAAQTQEPAWNFNKYLLNAEGKVVQYFPSNVTPESAEMQSAVDKLLPAR